MRGGDTTGLRAYNERLIMNALLRAGPLSKAEIARETGLSGQAASVIVNRLLDEKLLVKREKIRGQVGQPSTPIAPNPEGAFSLGVKIGRRSSEAVLVNLLGEIMGAERTRYDAPLPDPALPSALAQAKSLLDGLALDKRKRVVGLGIAMPGEIHAWSHELGLEAGALDGWRGLDVAGALEEATGLAASLHNDATAACAAEMVLGDSITVRSALYVYLGTFIGGGVVLNGQLYPGEQLNAAAIGSMPVGESLPSGPPNQLIHTASVIALERALAAAGLEPSECLAGDGGAAAEAIFAQWMEEAVAHLSRALVAALSLIDFELIVVDGLLPPAWRTRFTEALLPALDRYDRVGLAPVGIRAGSIGPMARVLGAAMLPLKERFSPDTGLLVRLGESRHATSWSGLREEAAPVAR
jgi:predicted NBD/HSP70 family sugar kinase